MSSAFPLLIAAKRPGPTAQTTNKNNVFMRVHPFSAFPLSDIVESPYHIRIGEFNDTKNDLPEYTYFFISGGEVRP
jgi:hypothetical protein